MNCPKCRIPLKPRGRLSGLGEELVCLSCGHKAVGPKSVADTGKGLGTSSVTTVYRPEEFERRDPPPAPEETSPEVSAPQAEAPKPPKTSEPVAEAPKPPPVVVATPVVAPAPKPAPAVVRALEPAEPSVPKKKGKGQAAKAKKAEPVRDLSKLRDEVAQLSSDLDALEKTLGEEIHALRASVDRLSYLLEEND